MLAGKLAAEVVVNRLNGGEEGELKAVHSSVLSKVGSWKERRPTPVFGEGAIAFGGGAERTGVSIQQ